MHESDYLVLLCLDIEYIYIYIPQLCLGVCTEHIVYVVYI